MTACVTSGTSSSFTMPVSLYIKCEELWPRCALWLHSNSLWLYLLQGQEQTKSLNLTHRGSKIRPWTHIFLLTQPCTVATTIIQWSAAYVLQSCTPDQKGQRVERIRQCSNSKEVRVVWKWTPYIQAQGFSIITVANKQTIQVRLLFLKKKKKWISITKDHSPR